jgi:hypothetical protein
MQFSVARTTTAGSTADLCTQQQLFACGLILASLASYTGGWAMFNCIAPKQIHKIDYFRICRSLWLALAQVLGIPGIICAAAGIAQRVLSWYDT